MMKKRILIVEDESIVAMNESEMMHELGYEVIGIAMSGEVAIQRAGRDKPDLILMDIKLLGDMNGCEAALRIRELYQIPIVYVTAYGDKETSKSGNFSVPEGFGYIVKPFTKDELESEIKRIMG